MSITKAKMEGITLFYIMLIPLINISHINNMASTKLYHFFLKSGTFFKYPQKITCVTVWNSHICTEISVM